MRSFFSSQFHQIKLSPWRIDTEYIRSYIIQLLVFSYTIYKYLSRSYETYGIIPSDLLNYPRWWIADLYKLPALHFSTFQFIYDSIPHPNAALIRIIQYLIVGFSFSGLIGIYPKISAFITFILAIHLEGIFISADAEISGGTILLISLLIISISPTKALYKINKINKLSNRSNESSTLVFLFCLAMGIYYFLPFLNKLLDTGFFPLSLRLDLAAESIRERQFLFNFDFSVPFLVNTQTSAFLSFISGLVVWLSQLASILFITNFRYKYLLVITHIVMHTMVYFMVGINFTGNSILLLAILDWGSLFQKGNLYYDDKCNFCIRCRDILKKYIKPTNIIYEPLSSLENKRILPNHYNKSLNIRRAEKAIALESESDIMYGFNTIAALLLRSKFFIFGLIMYLPPINLLGIILYKIISDNRYLLAGKCDSGQCKL